MLSQTLSLASGGSVPVRTAAIATAQAQWLKGSQEGKAVGVLTFDLSAAFDTVGKEHLLPRLATLGIGGTELTWFD